MQIHNLHSGRFDMVVTSWDGQPTPSALRPWIHRFSRPIPEGTAPLADIGSVAWSFDFAYQTGG